MNTNLNMEKDYMENSVKISLSFTGDEIPFEKITNILEVNPTYTRKKAEWRIQNEFTTDEWVFDFKEMNCTDVEKLFVNFIKIFELKSEQIKNICRDYKCEVYVIVVIHMENCAQPYTWLSPNTIGFLHSINTTLVLDIYGYDTVDHNLL
jgi:hypothetical protein